jgi:23S rRNA pseudouridine1911/1915/1917 synthase
MMQEKEVFIIDVPGERIDSYIASVTELSRSNVQKLIESGAILVNGKPCKANYKLRTGDVAEIQMPEPEDIEALPENIPLDIIYEDSDIIVINKARGMVVHPAAGNYTGTLVNALLYHCKDLSDINGVRRPGIVHRIDKDTTGLLAVAKNNNAHLVLAEQLQDHTMSRVYYAVVEGIIGENSGTVNAPIGRHDNDRKKMAVNTRVGKPAVTHFEVIERLDNCTLVKCRLETGRTHQIRVHMAYTGHPVTGDPVYGIKNNRGMEGQALHAGELTLIHPATGRPVTFKAPLPDDFEKLLKRLRR